VNCEQADELIGAYALDALPDDEAAQMRAHIETCARHATEASELRAVAARLPALAGEVQPPVALRTRVLDAVRATPQTPEREAPRSLVRGPRARGISATGRDWRVQWGALAAVLVAAIGGLLAWNVVLMQRLDDDGATEFASAITATSALESADGMRAGTVVYFGDEREAVLIADGLDALDASRETYQLWSLVDGEATSLGLMTPDDAGRASMAFAYDARVADALAITVEPAGGSTQPTTDPVYVAEL
jgi:anti-sigma-K factor RskA